MAIALLQGLSCKKKGGGGYEYKLLEIESAGIEDHSPPDETLSGSGEGQPAAAKGKRLKSCEDHKAEQTVVDHYPPPTQNLGTLRNSARLAFDNVDPNATIWIMKQIPPYNGYPRYQVVECIRWRNEHLTFSLDATAPGYHFDGYSPSAAPVVIHGYFEGSPTDAGVQSSEKVETIQLLFKREHYEFHVEIAK